MKHHGFFLRMTRLFTAASADPYRDLRFIESESGDEDSLDSFAYPANWGAMAGEVLAQAAMAEPVPAHTRPVEENTVPSWLWRSRPASSAQPQPCTQESDARQVFDRVAGAAACIGWHRHILQDESAAATFYDELRYALAHRLIALHPAQLASFGRDWRYGLAAETTTSAAAPAPIAITNQAIDAMVGGSRDKTLRAGWQKIAEQWAKSAPTQLRFSDIDRDWGASNQAALEAALDLMALRHNDGTLNIEALRHAVRLLVITLDLHQSTPGPLAIGFVNLAPLLMALAIPYDSEAGRAYAASVAGIITAQAYATSSELAGLRGGDPAFIAEREAGLRHLRNHRRAAYGESSDYEKISVLPAPLQLADCPDLALAAAARAAWDDALDAARRYGLRHAQVTGLDLSPPLRLFMSGTPGIAPLPALTVLTQDGEAFSRAPLPVVTEALTRLGVAAHVGAAVRCYLTGTLKLDDETRVKLRLTPAALAQVEAYLPQVDTLRLAVTPHILGEDFCRKALKIPATKLNKPGFDLLAECGFDAAAIESANAAIYGRPSLRGSQILAAKDTALFATADSVTPEAQIRMAAAVQGLISGVTGLHLSLAAAVPADKLEKLLLHAWQRGVKDIRLDYDAPAAAPARPAVKRRAATAAFLHRQTPALPRRAMQLKGKPGMGGLMKAKSKPHPSKRAPH